VKGGDQGGFPRAKWISIGVSINGGTPIAGWFISWKIPFKWMITGSTPMDWKPPNGSLVRWRITLAD